MRTRTLPFLSRSVWALVFMVLFCAAPVHAAVYNINFSISNTMDGTLWNGATWNTGEAPVEYAGSTWNDKDYSGTIGGTLINVGLTDILDSEGNNSSIDFTTTSNGIWAANAYFKVINDYIYTYDYEGDGDPSRSFSFSGLDTTLSYDIYFMAANGDADNQIGTFTINGISYSLADDDGIDNDSLGALTSWEEGHNYVVFKGLTPDLAGTITGSYTAINTFGLISGIQIVSTPLPSSSLLLVAGLLSVLGIRRKN